MVPCGVRVSVRVGVSLLAQMGKNPPANAEDSDLIPELGKSQGEGDSYSLQYSRLENPMDRGAWQAIVHRVAKSQTRLK